jgi:hypothetical protein
MSGDTVFTSFRQENYQTNVFFYTHYITFILIRINQPHYFQPLTEMTTRVTSKEKFVGSKARPVHEAENITAICKPIIETIWGPEHLTIL